MRRMMLLALPALVACKMERDEFIEKLAQTSCELSEECSPDEFGATFDDTEECVNFYVGFMGLMPDEEDGCNYDAGAARDCLKEAKAATCDDYDDEIPACDEVFTGDGCELSYDYSGDTGA